MENKYLELIAWLKNFPDATKITKEAYNEGVNVFATLSSNRSLLRFFQSRVIVERHKNMLHSQLTQILKAHIDVVNVVEEKKAVVIIEQQKEKEPKTPIPPKGTKEKKKTPPKKTTEIKSSKKK
jgi:hypothetical protein